MPRFAILDHDQPFRHWDFLLEDGTALRAWRLVEEPRRTRQIAAEPLADHRLAYLDYEGPVGGERGRVLRWDAGTFTWESEADGALRIRLDGERISGIVILSRLADGRWVWEWA